MRFYLSGPSKDNAHVLVDMPVLISFPSYGKWIEQFHPSFSHILIDSGAFSEHTMGKKVDIQAYKDWSEQWLPTADAIAGLDDLSGDYKRSMKNYEVIPWSFPTWHDTDPFEIIPDLVAIAKERNTWIGLSTPPINGKFVKTKEKILRKALEYIPEDLHVHGFALGAYSYIRRFNSFDSTAWWRDAFVLRGQLKWLTYTETLEIIIKRYQRQYRLMKEEKENPQSGLFDVMGEE